MRTTPGDYVIKGVQGEFYPCKPGIFAKTYEAVADTGLAAEQVWGLPEGSVIWPERAVNPEPWMRRSDTWESISEFAGDAGVQFACGYGFTVLRLGGGE